MFSIFTSISKTDRQKTPQYFPHLFPFGIFRKCLKAAFRWLISNLGNGKLAQNHQLFIHPISRCKYIFHEHSLQSSPYSHSNTSTPSLPTPSVPCLRGVFELHWTFLPTAVILYCWHYFFYLLVFGFISHLFYIRQVHFLSAWKEEEIRKYLPKKQNTKRKGLKWIHGQVWLAGKAVRWR